MEREALTASKNRGGGAEYQRTEPSEQSSSLKAFLAPWNAVIVCGEPPALARCSTTCVVFFAHKYVFISNICQVRPRKLCNVASEVI